MSVMSSTTTPAVSTVNNYKAAVEAILSELRRDRDRQIIARRFGFGLAKRQTLEKIGGDFNITRERVRQIEKAAIIKLRAIENRQITEANLIILEILHEAGGVALISQIAEVLGVPEKDTPYVVFLSLLVPGAELIDEDDDLRAAVGTLPIYSRQEITGLLKQVVATVTEIGHPTTLQAIKASLENTITNDSLQQVMLISKKLAFFDAKWGLISWPEVNPKSIRDKTYLVLARHGKPLHFSDIASHIRNLGTAKRDVTVQAVHNELIKDRRFVLIGRGIYALAEWGYTPGTVAEIIAGVLRSQSPLHKDEIVKRVLEKRQVKTTTIILNLQEKDQFQRVAKATYTLKEK
jgi:DNA-directed RNA polymerase delta subunit